jgi:hypothetical protein
MKILIVLLLNVNLCLSEDFDKLIEDLGDVNYETREEAEAKLISYSSDYVNVFLKLSHSFEDNPEIQYRLQKIAKHIFYNKNVQTDYRWLKYHAILGLDVYTAYSRHDDENGDSSWEAFGLVVEGVYPFGSCDEKLLYLDWIISIDDINLIGQENVLKGYELLFSFKPDEIHNVKVRRLKKDCKIFDRDEFSFRLFDDRSRYDILEFNLKVGWKDEREIDKETESNLINDLWREFLYKHINEYCQK